MAGRAALFAAVAGVGVAVTLGGLSFSAANAFGTGLVIGSLAAATSFAVSMLLFVITMPRLEPRLAVWASLTLGAVAAFVVGSVIQPVAIPV